MKLRTSSILAFQRQHKCLAMDLLPHLCVLGLVGGWNGHASLRCLSSVMTSIFWILVVGCDLRHGVTGGIGQALSFYVKEAPMNQRLMHNAKCSLDVI